MMVNPAAAFPVGSALYDGNGVASSGLLNKDQVYSLTFTNRDTSQMPHTVTFRAGRPSPEVITPVPQPDGPPLLRHQPAARADR